ncbi:RIC1 domain-containing protein [Mycena kentingensis (nom. inval.)]|nr:RIC1 domain-containing protein [Mycena kentingensis (nom. inval.)]
MADQISYTPEGAVVISYKDLIESPLSLSQSIEKAFGSDSDCLGIIVVRDLPEVYPKYRERLLKLSYSFAQLDESVREQYADVQSRYSFGWSHGKEIMNNKPDLLKGSYYANPIVDPVVSDTLRQIYPEYYNDNIWPKSGDVEGFEEAFKDLGKFIFAIAVALAVACQPFALSQLNDATMSLPDLISTSNTTKARLLHYFPTKPSPEEEEAMDSYCGVHKDHGLLTGLCSAMYLQENGTTPEIVPSPSPQSGLYIATRGDRWTKVTIPPTCLAFQTGEALEIATGGKLRATPHCVRIGATPEGSKISRETFALFTQPSVECKLSPALTFGQFSKHVFSEHYEDKPTD